jgi:outer membrane protein assembly factor BamB
MRARWIPVLIGFGLTARAAPAAPPHWAQWRGPDGQGIASDRGVPLEWSPTKNVIIGYDPATGRELWRMKGLASNAVPSPVAGDGLVVLSSGFPAKIALAVRPGGSGDVTDTDRVLWRYDKGTAYVPSPILVGGLLYLVTDKGLVSCLDARTGKVHYEGGRPPVGARFMASPVAVAGHLLLASMDGDTVVLKQGTSHEVVRSNPLGEPIAASPAVAGGRLYIRGEQHLFAIGAP